MIVGTLTTLRCVRLALYPSRAAYTVLWSTDRISRSAEAGSLPCATSAMRTLARERAASTLRLGHCPRVSVRDAAVLPAPRGRYARTNAFDPVAEHHRPKPVTTVSQRMTRVLPGATRALEAATSVSFFDDFMSDSGQHRDSTRVMGAYGSRIPETPKSSICQWFLMA